MEEQRRVCGSSVNQGVDLLDHLVTTGNTQQTTVQLKTSMCEVINISLVSQNDLSINCNQTLFVGNVFVTQLCFLST